MNNEYFIDNIEDIDLIVYDFDGVMTDNRVIIFQDGTEGVFVNRADGLGVEMLKSLSITQLILSTETNPVVNARGKKLGIEVISSCSDKKGALAEYCKINKYGLNNVLYIGNDLNDMEVMKIVGFPVAPADAHDEIKKISKFVTKNKGGEGVIREISDIIRSHYNKKNGE
jgi:3-deoxy-D-manno-octulosonate 8-phosphate phosphatase (KDO 8-P phosphatase)